MNKQQDEFDAIESGLIALHKTNFHHRAWEDIQSRAGVSLDRSSALLLKVVHHCGTSACRMQDIAKLLGIEAPSVTRTVQDLEQAGLVHRRPDPEDKRATLVTLTKQGEQQLAKLQKARRERLKQAMAHWSRAERQQLGSSLQKLADDISATYK